MSGRTTISADVIKTTDEAVLAEINGAERWIPRSVLLDGDGVEEGDSDLCVETWWLNKNKPR